MADQDKTAERPSSEPMKTSCCAPQVQATCCDPADKQECCGSDPTAVTYGCR
jgi:hypothetical protein